MPQIKRYHLPTEAQEQTLLFLWAAAQECVHPELRLMLHVPNGGSRNAREAKNLKAQGVKPGVPDIFLPVARHGCNGLWIEMKRQKGGVVSKAQKQWFSDLASEGYFTAVCKGADEAIKTILWYLGGMLENETYRRRCADMDL